jgi:hypothetical protein
MTSSLASLYILNFPIPGRLIFTSASGQGCLHVHAKTALTAGRPHIRAYAMDAKDRTRVSTELMVQFKAASNR